MELEIRRVFGNIVKDFRVKPSDYGGGCSEMGISETPDLAREKTKRPTDFLARAAADLFSLNSVNNLIRHAFALCYHHARIEHRTQQGVEREMQRLLKRALEDFHEDLVFFGTESD